MALQLQKFSSTSKKSFDIEDADRPLSQIEEDVENAATKFSIKHYRRIEPTFGTLGFLFRNFRGGNSAVMELLRERIENNTAATKKMRQLLILWNACDEFSKSRVDIFDHLCKVVQLERDKFWGLFQEACFRYNNLLTQMAISSKTLELVEDVGNYSRKEKNYKDRELMAKMSNLTTEKPLVEINDNSTTVNNNLSIKDSNVGFSFSEMIKSGDKVVRKNDSIREMNEIELIADEQKLLEEGNNEDFIEGEIIKNDGEQERITVER